MDRIEAEGLKEFATERQAEYIDACVEHGSGGNAALALGVNKSTINRAVKRVRKKAAARGFAPGHDMVHTTPEGFAVKGTSTLYTHGEDGQRVAAQWVKTDRAREDAYAAAQVAAEELCETIKPVKARKFTGAAGPDFLVNVFIVTDYHIGMKAHGKETRGDDWDTSKAEQLLVDWFSAAIQAAPTAAQAVLGQIGDFLHWDGLDAVTPSSGHILDADTRFDKVVRVAIRVVRRIIEMLLDKYPTVHVIMAEGNHDIASSVWLRQMFAELYRDEPRVTVDTDHDTYHCFEWGECSIFFHHGHKRKPTNIDSVLVGKFREVYGRTKYSYCHMGHMHHDKVLETNLLRVEQHRTLAAADAYASRGGWLSSRSASVITYHKKYGEAARFTISPEMLNQSAA